MPDVPARWRAVLGAIGGGLIALSSGAHSLLGWPQVRQQLNAAGVGGDLLYGIEAGWQFVRPEFTGPT